MYGYTYRKKGSPRVYFYYKCHNAGSIGRTVCPGLTVPGKELEDYVVQALTNLSRDEKFLNDKKKFLELLREQTGPGKSDRQDELEKLKRDETALEDKKIRLLEKLEDGVIDDETFTQRFQHLKEELERNRALQAERDREASNRELEQLSLDASLEEITDFGRNWKFLDDEGKKAKLQTIVKQIRVTEDKVDMEIFVDVDNLSRKLRDS
jgi:hypothetical protein